MKIKDTISFEKFMELSKQLDIRIGHIADAERIPKSYGIKLTVNFSFTDEDGNISIITKTAFTNLGKTHEPKDLMGINCPFIMNLEPSVIKGVKSEVMIMVGEYDNTLEINPADYSHGTKLM